MVPWIIDLSTGVGLKEQKYHGRYLMIKKSLSLIWSARLRRRTLRGGILGTFWKPPSKNAFWEHFSEPFSTAKPIRRTLPQNPSQNLLRTLLRVACVVVQSLRRATNYPLHEPQSSQ